MADTLKILGQVTPAATTVTDLYTVPASRSATISSIVVCNRAATASTFRISVAAAGVADATSQYLYFDQAIDANSTYIATIGVTLATTDKVRVYTGTANFSITAFGVEVA